jgi:glyoxalase superfamily protein
MTARVSHTTVDCRNAYELSEWWKGVLDYVDVAGDPNEPGHEECMILARDGSHRLLFIEVPETKVGKNRIHLDLEPTEGTRDDELARLLAHGAVEFQDLRGQYGPGTGWVTLLDPEGNEFCILRNADERGATVPRPAV